MRRLWTLLYPGIRVKRWLLLFSLGLLTAGAGFALGIEAKIWGRMEDILIDFFYHLTGQLAGPYITGFFLMIIGIIIIAYSMHRLIQSIMNTLFPDSPGRLTEALYHKRYLKRGPKVVVFGGGTGLSTLLRGLKSYTSNVTAVVTVADDGGSSGRLRKEFGILPPGDFRNCLVALADTEPLMEELFQYRFTHGEGLTGHSFGNLFIAAMTDIAGDFESAVRQSSTVLAVRGHVLASTLENVQISAEYDDGTIIRGESKISEQGRPIKKLLMEPEDATTSEQVKTAVREADLIVLGPGSLYTSVITTLLVKDIREEIQKAKSAKVYICNVMTQPGETDGYRAEDHLQAVIEHGGEGIVDTVIVNNEEVPEELAEKYKETDAFEVKYQRDSLQELGVQVVEESLISKEEFARHDSDKLGELVYQLAMRKKISAGNPFMGLLARAAPKFLARYYHTGQ